MDDTIGWSKEASGSFSVGSAYIASGEEGLTEAAKWNSIWKLKVPNRVCTFIWLVKHNRIMTNENRAKRGITKSDSCWFCTNIMESVDHVLRHCPFADSVWRAVLPAFFEKTKYAHFPRWLEEGITNKGNGRHPVNNNTVFTMTLWWVWEWRNDAIFNNTVKPLQFKTSWISSQVEGINRAFCRANNPCGCPSANN